MSVTPYPRVFGERTGAHIIAHIIFMKSAAGLSWKRPAFQVQMTGR
jgi:hypothetical protein